MYANAMRTASDVMEDDHVKIGENGRLYRVDKISTMKVDDLELVAFQLYYAGDDTRTPVAFLCVKPSETLKVYNQ